MESGKDQASQQLAEAADSIHQSADELRDRQHTWLADLVDRGAEQLDRVSDTLRSNDLQGLLNQLDGFARRQPALFAGASMIAGFALARMARVALDQGDPIRHNHEPGFSPSTPSPEPAGAGVLCMDEVRDTRSLGHIVGDIATDALNLVRGELALARAELDQKMDRALWALSAYSAECSSPSPDSWSCCSLQPPH